MEVTIVNSNVIVKNNWILKPNFHMNYGKKRIEKALRNKQKFSTLGEVTDSVFTGGIFKRIFVDNPDYGFPYISAQHMMNANPLEVAKCISKKYTPKLEEMTLKENQILVSCAGTVGNIKLITKDLTEVVGSQDIIRIDADNSKMPYGYLYAYLSTKTAYNYIQSFIYGSVVPRIEPNTLSLLPVPLLPESKQQQIHQLIVDASALRVEANKLLKEAVDVFNFMNIEYKSGSFKTSKISINKVNNYKKRFDANYNVVSTNVEEIIERQKIEFVTISELSSGIFIGPRSKRNYISNGVPFLSTSEMQKANPTKTEKFVGEKASNGFIVKEGWLLTTRSGTLGDTIFTLPCINGFAVSEDAIRIVLKEKTKVSNKYLFAFLKSNIGVNSLVSGSYGSVILHLNEEYIGDIKVPILDIEKNKLIDLKIENYISNLNQAILKENQAIDLIEKEIDAWQ